jgi:hypothetical protein
MKLASIASFSAYKRADAHLTRQTAHGAVGEGSSLHSKALTAACTDVHQQHQQLGKVPPAYFGQQPTVTVLLQSCLTVCCVCSHHPWAVVGLDISQP